MFYEIEAKIVLEQLYTVKFIRSFAEMIGAYGE